MYITMNNQFFFTFFFIAVVAIIILVFIRRKFKRLVTPNVFLVSGAVKMGKTFLSLHLAYKQYKKNLFKWRFVHFFHKIFGLGSLDCEAPMFYSNIPLAGLRYNPFTKDILMRKVRIPSHSVVFLDEISLLAGSMLYKDKEINNALLVFVKLFAHLTHNGSLYMNTQSVSDLHFAFRRCLGSYIYVYDSQPIPFFKILSVREMMYSDDSNMVNTSTNDVELSMRKIIVRKRVHKFYDSTCYSSLADGLPLQVNYDYPKKKIGSDLRSFYIVTLEDFGKELNLSLESYQTTLENEKAAYEKEYYDEKED